MAQDKVKNADVIWLAGGDSPTQFAYSYDYGMCDDSAIVNVGDNTIYIGDIYLIDNRSVIPV